MHTRYPIEARLDAASAGSATLSVQDLAVLAYLLVLLAAVLSGEGPQKHHAIDAVLLDLTAYGLGLALTRGLVGAPRFRALAYRVLAPAIVILSYFQLRTILPVVTTASHDQALYALDLRLFGVEPALAWDRFVTPATTEWFASFYFGYFFLLAGYLVAMTLGSRDRLRLSAFGLGILTVFCGGHLGYMLVPGVGPYAALAGHFTHALDGPVAWKLVQSSVSAGGALQDIFPSLHTAAPTFLTLFSFRHRRVGAHRYLWPVIGVITSQIIVATMFLRWHYLIDVIAGLTLAVAADALSHRVARWEHARRRARGLPAAYDLTAG